MSNLDQNQLAQIQQAMTAEQFEIAHMLGQAQFAEFIEKVSAVGRIKLWAHIKETKKYKGLAVIDANGNCRHVGTWEEFCQSQGKSRSTVDEEIQNLNILGEEFLEKSKKIGLSSRDLRNLRAVPVEDQLTIINSEEVKNSDREGLLELLDDVYEKHAKVKAAQDKRIAELEADAEAKDAIIRKKDETINKLDTDLNVLNSPLEIKLRKEAEHQSIEKAALQTLSAASLTFLNAVMRFQNEVNSVLDTAEQHHILDINARAEETVVATYQRIAQFSQKLGVVVDFENMVSPEWLFPNADPIAELAELEQFMPAVETDMEQ